MGNDKTEIMGDQADSAAVQDLEQQCPHCAADMLEGEQFCPKCGYQRGSWQESDSAAAEQTADDRPVAYELRSGSGGTWPVYAGENEIGRGDVSIQLDNPYASRLHARIVVDEDGGATIEDLGSSNGTLVAGEQIAANEAIALEPGIEFSIGAEVFSLYQPPEEEPEVQSAGEEEPASTEQADEAEPVVADSSDEEEEAAGEDAAPDSDVVLSPWSLVIGEGEPHDLPVGETVLGRKAGASDIVIEGDGYVSGTHCKVSAGLENLTIEDLGSTNGTKVDDEPLPAGEPLELSPGTIVTVGQTTIEIRFSEETDPPAAEDQATSEEDGESGAPAEESAEEA